MRQNLHPATPFSGLRSDEPPKSPTPQEIDDGSRARARAVLIRLPWMRARSESHGTQGDKTTPARQSTDRWAA